MLHYNTVVPLLRKTLDMLMLRKRLLHSGLWVVQH